jgi:hypothetical protein
MAFGINDELVEETPIGFGVNDTPVPQGFGSNDEVVEESPKKTTLTVSPLDNTDYDGLIIKHGEASNVSPDLIKGLIKQESQFKTGADSGKARGLTQFTPGTGKQYGLLTDEDFANPDKSINASARYLNDLMGYYESKGVKGDDVAKLALGAYNGGHQAERLELYKKYGTAWVDHLREMRTDNPNYDFDQNQGYINKVFDNYKAYSADSNRVKVGQPAPVEQPTVDPVEDQSTLGAFGASALESVKGGARSLLQTAPLLQSINTFLLRRQAKSTGKRAEDLSKDTQATTVEELSNKAKITLTKDQKTLDSLKKRVEFAKSKGQPLNRGIPVADLETQITELETKLANPIESAKEESMRKGRVAEAIATKYNSLADASNEEAKLLTGEAERIAKQVGLEKKSYKDLEGVPGYLQDVVAGGTDLAVMIGLGFLNPTLSTGYITSKMTSGTYEGMVEKGISPENSAAAAVVSAIPNIALEKMGLEGVAPTLITKGLSKSLAKKTTTRIINGALAEGLTEALQTYPEAYAELYAKNADLPEEERVERTLDEFMDITKEAGYSFLVSAPLGGLGGGIDVLANPTKKTEALEEIQNQAPQEDDFSAAVEEEVEVVTAPTLSDQEITELSTQLNNLPEADRETAITNIVAQGRVSEDDAVKLREGLVEGEPEVTVEIGEPEQKRITELEEQKAEIEELKEDATPEQIEALDKTSTEFDVEITTLQSGDVTAKRVEVETKEAEVKAKEAKDKRIAELTGFKKEEVKETPEVTVVEEPTEDVKTTVKQEVVVEEDKPTVAVEEVTEVTEEKAPVTEDKPVEKEVEPQIELAKELGLRYEGVQESVEGQPGFDTYTVDVEGQPQATFIVKEGSDVETIKAKRDKILEPFKKADDSIKPVKAEPRPKVVKETKPDPIKIAKKAYKEVFGKDAPAKSTVTQIENAISREESRTKETDELTKKQTAKLAAPKAVVIPADKSEFVITADAKDRGVTIARGDLGAIKNQSALTPKKSNQKGYISGGFIYQATPSGLYKVVGKVGEDSKGDKVLIPFTTADVTKAIGKVVNEKGRTVQDKENKFLTAEQAKKGQEIQNIGDIFSKKLTTVEEQVESVEAKTQGARGANEAIATEKKLLEDVTAKGMLVDGDYIKSLSDTEAKILKKHLEYFPDLDQYLLTMSGQDKLTKINEGSLSQTNVGDTPFTFLSSDLQDVEQDFFDDAVGGVEGDIDAGEVVYNKVGKDYKTDTPATKQEIQDTVTAIKKAFPSIEDASFRIAPGLVKRSGANAAVLITKDGSAMVVVDPSIATEDLSVALLEEFVGHFGVEKLFAQDPAILNDFVKLFAQEKLDNSKFYSRLKEVYGDNEEIIFKEFVAKSVREVAKNAINKDGTKNDAFFNKDKSGLLTKVYKKLKQLFHKILSRTPMSQSKRDEAARFLIHSLGKVSPSVKAQGGVYHNKVKTEISRLLGEPEAVKKPTKMTASQVRASKTPLQGITSLTQLVRDKYSDDPKRAAEVSAKALLINKIDDKFFKLVDEVVGKFSDTDKERNIKALTRDIKRYNKIKGKLNKNEPLVELANDFVKGINIKPLSKAQTERLTEAKKKVDEGAITTQAVTRELEKLSNKAIKDMEPADIANVSAILQAAANTNKEIQNKVELDGKEAVLQDVENADGTTTKGIVTQTVELLNNQKVFTDPNSGKDGKASLKERVSSQVRNADYTSRFLDNNKKNGLFNTIFSKNFDNAYVSKLETKDAAYEGTIDNILSSISGEILEGVTYQEALDKINNSKLSDKNKKKQIEKIRKRGKKAISNFQRRSSEKLNSWLGRTITTLKRGEGVKKYSVKVEGDSVTLTAAEKMYLNMITRNQDIYNQLLDNGISLTKRKADTVKFKDSAQLNEAIKLTPEEQTYADNLMATFDKDSNLIREANAESLKHFGYEVFNQDDYFTVKRVVAKDSAEEDLSPINLKSMLTATGENQLPLDVQQHSSAHSRNPKNANITKAREINNNPFEVQDAFQAFANHLDEVTQFTSYAGAYNTALKFLHSKTGDKGLTVRETIQSKAGDMVLSNLENMLEDVSSDTPRRGDAEKGINAVTQKAVVNVLGNKITVVAKQLMAVPQYMAVTPPKYWPHYLNPGAANFLNPKEYTEMLEKSPAVKERYDNQPAKLVGIEQNAVEANRLGVDPKTFEAFAMKGLTLMDAVPTTMAWSATKAEIKDSGKYEVGSDAYWKAVRDLHWDKVKSSQPTSESHLRSKFLSDSSQGGKQIGKLVAPFYGPQNKNAMMVMNSLADVKIGIDEIKTGDKKSGREKVLTGIVQSLLVTLGVSAGEALIGAAFDDEEKEVANRLIGATGGNLASMVPIVGEISGGLTTALAEDKVFGSSTVFGKAVDQYREVGVTLGKLVKGDATFKDVGGSVLKLLDLMAGTGVAGLDKSSEDIEKLITNLKKKL